MHLLRSVPILQNRVQSYRTCTELHVTDMSDLPGHCLLGLQWGIQVSQAALAKSLFIRIVPSLLGSPFQSELSTVLSRILVYEDTTS